MYTDGLVERRDRPVHLGIDQAAAHLAAISTNSPRTKSSTSLHEDLIGDQLSEDDIAILVVEHIAELTG